MKIKRKAPRCVSSKKHCWDFVEPIETDDNGNVLYRCVRCGHEEYRPTDYIIRAMIALYQSDGRIPQK